MDTLDKLPRLIEADDVDANKLLYGECRNISYLKLKEGKPLFQIALSLKQEQRVSIINESCSQ